MLSPKKCLTLAAAAAVSAALLAPGTFAAEANAAPASSSTASAPDARGFSLDRGLSFVAGARATVTGTAAPHSTVTLQGLPGKEWTEVQADASGRWSATSTAVATDRFKVGASDATAFQSATVLPTKEQGDEVPIRVDDVRFTKGERFTVSGTAAPGAQLVIEGIPTGENQGFPMGLTGAVAGADGSFRAGGMIMTTDLDRFDMTFRLGGQSVVATAVSTTATPDLVVTSPEAGATVHDAANKVTFTGTSTLGGAVRVETTGGRVLAVGKADPVTGEWALRGEIAFDIMYTLNVVADGADGATATVQHQVQVKKPVS